MSTNQPGKTEAAQEGPHLGNLLRDCLVSAVLTITREQKIVALAGKAEQFLGLTAPQVLPQSLEILPAPLQKIARSTLASGQSLEDQPVEIRLASGKLLMLGVSAFPFKMGKNSSGLTLVLHDLASARRLEQDVCRLGHLASIGTLSASMAHEIKNALVAGKTFLDLLLEKNRDAELTGIVRREFHRIDAIVSQMLTFAAPAKTTFSAVGLHKTLEHSLRLMRPQLETRSIALNRSFHAAPDLVDGNDVQLEQAFLNLFLNALEAMAPHGSLTVATSNVSGPGRHLGAAATAQLLVTVSDTGTGILPENMGRLFEPFFTTKTNGTGLGLPITSRIIQEHKGSIKVESTVNNGTVFSIILPALAQAHQRNSSRPAPAKFQTTISQRAVL